MKNVFICLYVGLYALYDLKNSIKFWQFRKRIIVILLHRLPSTDRRLCFALICHER